MRVPLPEGWRAIPQGDDLLVGPATRSLLLLEKTDLPWPDQAALRQALSEEDVRIVDFESLDAFIFAHYALKTTGNAQSAFLGVRRLGAHTIWCSSLGRPADEEVALALRVCRELTWAAE